MNVACFLRQEAALAARELSTDALLSFADALSFTIADDDPVFPGPVGRRLAGERLRAVREEIARRERLARVHSGLASPSDRSYEAWRTLAAMERERVDIRAVFEAAGWKLADEGPTEAHASCPACGGTDRLVIRFGPPARCWCRRCDWSADVITLAQSIIPGCHTFRDAVRVLAEIADLAVETER